MATASASTSAGHRPNSPAGGGAGGRLPGGVAVAGLTSARCARRGQGRRRHHALDRRRPDRGGARRRPRRRLRGGSRTRGRRALWSVKRRWMVAVAGGWSTRRVACRWVAAGGLADGRGLAAALAIGACGVWMGTRFVASAESGNHPGYKRRITEASFDDLVETTLFDGGWPNRRTGWSATRPWRVGKRRARPGPGAVRARASGSVASPTARRCCATCGHALGAMEGDWEAGPHYAGTSAALVCDGRADRRYPGAARRRGRSGAAASDAPVSRTPARVAAARHEGDHHENVPRRAGTRRARPCSGSLPAQHRRASGDPCYCNTARSGPAQGSDELVASAGG